MPLPGDALHRAGTSRGFVAKSGFVRECCWAERGGVHGFCRGSCGNLLLLDHPICQNRNDVIRDLIKPPSMKYF